MHSFRNVVVLTGAGISRESGLDTFRDADGAWARVNVEDVATPRGFRRNPSLVHQFYNARRRQLFSGSIQPNAAHLALADLQRSWTGDVRVITQNIDDLHERAGTLDVVHLHGELRKAFCGVCRESTSCTNDLSTESTCPCCGVAGRMRPDVVWFGESPLHMELVDDLLTRADLFLSVGTSGTVYPAAGFVEIAREAGAHTVELNLEKSLGASSFHEARYGPATEVVKRYVAELLVQS